jgi:hypothetical protein
MPSEIYLAELLSNNRSDPLTCHPQENSSYAARLLGWESRERRFPRPDRRRHSANPLNIHKEMA